METHKIMGAPQNYTYLDAGNHERMFDEGSDLLESEDFDHEVAGARLLGRDMAAILRPQTKEALLKILDKETGDQSRYTLIASMVEHGAERTDFEKALRLLEQTKAGILEKAWQCSSKCFSERNEWM
jgi:predicted nucleotidyltransferase